MRTQFGRNRLLLAPAAILAIALTGCLDQNPFPATGVVTRNAPVHHDVYEPYFIDAPQSVRFQEGKVGSFTILPRTPAGETPMIVAKNLPTGASFDPTTNTLSWTPGPTDGHDPTNPTVFSKDYPVEFDLRTSGDSLKVDYITNVDIIVSGVAHPLALQTGGSQFDVKEGSTFSMNLTVHSDDFPQGPFALQFDNLPDGGSITPNPNDPTQFTFSFTPAYSLVTPSDQTDANGYIKDLHINATATGPRAQTVQSTFDIIVHDVPQVPAVSIGDNLVFSYAAEFSVTAEDMNGEAAPVVTVDKPAFGSASVEVSSSSRALAVRKPALRTNPVQVAVVDWTGIPASQFNKPQTLTVHSCARTGTSQVPICTANVVQMVFDGQLFHAPVFDRTQWDLGTIQYVRAGSTLNVTVPVRDYDDSTDTPTVVVAPAWLQTQINYADGSITLQPVSSGVQSFTLVATSRDGIQDRESFTYRALPRNWGSMILLGQSNRDPEVQATLKLNSDSQVMNPDVDTIDSDALVLRKSLFVTTSAIESGVAPADLAALLTTATSSLPRVILSTPLIGKVPHPALPSDLKVIGRFNDLTIPGNPSLGAMTLVPTTGSVFAISDKPVRLSQSLTDQSTNPMILGATPHGKCTDEMDLTDGKTSLPVVLDCALDNGNHVLLGGFEWGDLYFDPSDAGLGQTWLQAWLQGASSSPHGRAKGRIR